MTPAFDPESPEPSPALDEFLEALRQGSPDDPGAPHPDIESFLSEGGRVVAETLSMFDRALDATRYCPRLQVFGYEKAGARHWQALAPEPFALGLHKQVSQRVLSRMDRMLHEADFEGGKLCLFLRCLVTGKHAVFVVVIRHADGTMANHVVHDGHWVPLALSPVHTPPLTRLLLSPSPDERRRSASILSNFIQSAEAPLRALAMGGPVPETSPGLSGPGLFDSEDAWHRRLLELITNPDLIDALCELSRQELAPSIEESSLLLMRLTEAVVKFDKHLADRLAAVQQAHQRALRMQRNKYERLEIQHRGLQGRLQRTDQEIRRFQDELRHARTRIDEPAAVTSTDLAQRLAVYF